MLCNDGKVMIRFVVLLFLELEFLQKSILIFYSACLHRESQSTIYCFCSLFSSKDRNGFDYHFETGGQVWEARDVCDDMRGSKQLIPPANCISSRTRRLVRRRGSNSCLLFHKLISPINFLLSKAAFVSPPSPLSSLVPHL